MQVARYLRERSGPGHFVPDSKSFASESAVISSGEQVTPWSEMRGDDSVHLDEALRVPGGLEPPHASLPLTRRLMRVLSPVVQVPVLPVSNARHHDSFGRSVAPQFIGHDHARTAMARGPQQLAEESHSRESVPLWLDENVDDDAVLIDGAP